MKQFGNTLKETSKALSGRFGTGGRGAADLKQQRLQAWVRILVSLTVLVFGMYLLVTSTDETKAKTGISLISVVTGYWLR